MPWRVVVDPNVLVSAAIAGGNPQRVVDLARLGVIEMVACPTLLAELERVLARDRFLRWRSREQLDRFADGVRALCDVGPDPPVGPPRSRDPGDDYLVELALSAGVDLLCSGDLDLVDVTIVTVRTPAQLLADVLTDE